jgi:hypothetical protein
VAVITEGQDGHLVPGLAPVHRTRDPDLSPVPPLTFRTPPISVASTLSEDDDDLSGAEARIATRPTSSLQGNVKPSREALDQGNYAFSLPSSLHPFPLIRVALQSFADKPRTRSWGS